MNKQLVAQELVRLAKNLVAGQRSATKLNKNQKSVLNAAYAKALDIIEKAQSDLSKESMGANLFDQSLRKELEDKIRETK